MKKLYPYIFPALALLLVLFLAFRWYKLQTNRNSAISPFGEGVEIENLSETEIESVLKGADDYQSVDLVGQKDLAGQVRYEIKDGRVYFTVVASLPAAEDAIYQVWLKDLASDKKQKAFTLEYGKAGYFGSAAVPEDALPFEVVVTKEKNAADDEMEEVLLRATLSK
ncbi:MAG: hypothetical protein PVJ09_05300 [Candidatus Woesebacteria bacterium]|jgi:hypothetical protein